MSEETLARFLERVNTDTEFREKLKENWEEVIAELDELSPAELIAISTQDEDALRRLVNADVTAYSLNFYTTQLVCTLACPITLDTPNSGRGCGTGPRGTACCNTAGSGRGCGTGRCVAQ
jgi:hypothetical protein